MEPLIIGGVALAVVIVVIVVVMARRKPKAPAANAETFRSLMGVSQQAGAAATYDDPKFNELRQNLRVKFLYQEDKIDAAIEVERERNPTGSLEQWMRAAIERWERDNR